MTEFNYQIVLIEDDPDDAELIGLQLKKIKYPYELHVAGSFDEFKELDKAISPDLIISDYNLKEHNGIDVLRYVRTLKKYVPFILISGHIGEEKAVNTIKEGVDDYIMKDHLVRLVATVERLLADTDSKRRQLLNEKIFESIIDSSEVGVIVMNSDLQIMMVNELFKKISGFAEDELIGTSKLELYRSESQEKFKEELIEGFSHQNSFSHEWTLIRKDGKRRVMHSSISYIQISEDLRYAVSLTSDVTEAQRADRLRKQTEFISGVGSWQYDYENGDVYRTPKMLEIYGFKGENFDKSVDDIFKLFKEPYRQQIREAMANAIENGEEYKLEAELVSFDGVEKIVEITGKAITNGYKAKVLAGTMKDITKEKEKEKELEKLSMVAKQTQSSVVITDVEANIEWVNEAFTRMTGYEESEIIGKKPGDFLQGPKTKDEVINRMTAAIENKKAFTEEVLNYRKNGDKYWIRLVVTPIKNDAGEVTRFFSIQEDITQRKQAEIDLKETEQKLRNIVEHSTNLFYQHDHKGRFTYLSPQASSFLGIPHNKIGEIWTQYVTDNPVNEIGKERTEKAIETGKQQEPYELEIKKPNGETLWVQVNESPVFEDDGTVSIVGSLSDITDLKSFQDKLEKSRKSLIEAQHIGNIGNWDFDVNTGKITWSDEMFQIYERDSSLGPPDYEELLEYYPEDDLVIHNHYIDRALETGEGYEFEITLLAAKEKPKYIRALGIATKDREGKVIRLHGVVQDITPRKVAELELIESYRRIEEAQEIGVIGDWVLDVNNGNIIWSDMMYQIFERDLKAGNPTMDDIMDFYYKEHKIELMKCVKRAIEEGVVYDKDFKIITENGGRKYTRTVGQPIMDDKNRVIKLHGIVQDITSRKETEIELARKDRRIRNISNSIEGALLRYELLKDGTHKVDYISEGVEKLFGVTADEAMKDANALWANILDEDVEELSKSIEESAKSLTLWDQIYRLQVNDQLKWVHGRGTPQKLSDGTVRWDTVLLDITAQKKAESTNEVLLQEIHHRVKNNLAIISGLLQLEEFDTDDESLKYPLKRSQNRIHSMAKVHELLYRDKDFTNINFGDYIEELVDIIHSNMMADDNVTTYIRVKDVIMNVNSAIPLGILLNELLTNSFKYAFPQDASGKIEIEAKREGDYFEFVYRDDGVGFKDGVSLEQGGSMGLLIINTLLKQLEADYKVQTEGKFELQFKFRAKSRGSQSIISS